MNVHNVHERRLVASPEAVEALFADLDHVWPTQAFPAPMPEDGLLRLGPMLWERVERPDAPAAFRIVAPSEFSAEHWFELEPDGLGGTTIRHTVEGEAAGAFEPVWLDQVEPLHNAYIEAIFDRVEAATS